MADWHLGDPNNVPDVPEDHLEDDAMPNEIELPAYAAFEDDYYPDPSQSGSSTPSSLYCPDDNDAQYEPEEAQMPPNPGFDLEADPDFRPLDLFYNDEDDEDDDE